MEYFASSTTGCMGSRPGWILWCGRQHTWMRSSIQLNSALSTAGGIRCSSSINIFMLITFSGHAGTVLAKLNLWWDWNCSWCCSAHFSSTQPGRQSELRCKHVIVYKHTGCFSSNYISVVSAEEVLSLDWIAMRFSSFSTPALLNSSWVRRISPLVFNISIQI